MKIHTSSRVRRSPRTLGAICLATLLSTLGAASPATAALPPGPSVTRIEFLGSADPSIGVTSDWTVPARVAWAHFDVYGAQGGGCAGERYGEGGLGGLTAARIPVTPGQVLRITPGGMGGTACYPGGYDNQALGGFNGGGKAGRMLENPWTAGGGGGGSDVRRSPYGTGDRIVTAGGGGGGASEFLGSPGEPDGGAGGGPAGSSGDGNGQGGRGGTQSTTGGGGGDNGGGGLPGYQGGFGAGGDGGTDGNADPGDTAPGAGGGGGWFGGGGGGAGALTGGGGGGGSGNGPAGATMSSGVNVGPGKVILTYQEDNTPPELDLPADITLDTTVPSELRYSAFATDSSGPVGIACTPASGSTFPMGVTTVNCTATDRFDNTASGSFTVTLGDATPPLLSVPAAMTIEATSPSGAPVSYTVSATDAGGPVSASCTPASGSTFSFGTTTVSCNAVDPSGNTANGSFTVTVTDTTPPVLTVPADITVDAIRPSGATVGFIVSAFDLGGPVSPSCLPASESTFPVGVTTVNCTARDSSSNTGTGSFTISVKDAAEQLTDLLPTVTGVGSGTSLADKIRAAQSYLRAGDTKRACDALSAFIKEVRAAGRRISPTQAQELITTAQRIRGAIGC